MRKLSALKKRVGDLERRLEQMENMTLQNEAEDIPVTVPGGTRTIKPGPTAGGYDKSSGRFVMR